MWGEKEVGVGDEVDFRGSVEDEQSLPLDIARGGQAGMGFGEIGVVIAGVGDELESASGEMGEKGIEGNGIEGASRRDSDAAVGSGKAFLSNNAAEGWLKAAQECAGGAANPGGIWSGVEAPGRLKGVANGADAGFVRGAEDGAKYGRKHVGVLVCIDMGEGEAARLEQVDLGGAFCFNLSGVDAAGDQLSKERAECRL